MTIDAGFQETEIVTATATATAVVSLVKAPSAPETAWLKGHTAAVEDKAAYWKGRALAAEQAAELSDAAFIGAETEVKRRGLEIDKLAAEWNGQRNEAHAAREALAKLKAKLREGLAELVSEESIERDAANELLEKLGLDHLSQKYNATFTITVTVEGLERTDGKEIEHDVAAKAIEAHIDTLHGYQHDYISVDDIAVEELDEADA